MSKRSGNQFGNYQQPGRQENRKVIGDFRSHLEKKAATLRVFPDHRVFSISGANLKLRTPPDPPPPDPVGLVIECLQFIDVRQGCRERSVG